MRVAFFADDDSASQAALLTAHGLASVDRPVHLVQVSSQALPIPGTACPRPLIVTRVNAADCSELGLTALLDKVERTGDDVIVAAPLRLATAHALVRRRYLPVLPYGSTVLASGATFRMPSQPSAAGAPAAFPLPHWLLARDYHGVADARWQEAPAGPLRARPSGTRLLPVAMPLLQTGQIAALACGRPGRALLRQGVLLAAALEAAAADPSESRLDRAAFAEMFDPGADGDHGTRERLGVLAEMFERLSAGTGAPRLPQMDRRSWPNSRRSDRRAVSVVARSGNGRSRAPRTWHPTDQNPPMTPGAGLSLRRR